MRPISRRRLRRFTQPGYDRGLFTRHGIEINTVKSAYNCSWRRHIDGYDGGDILTRVNGGMFRRVGIDRFLEKVHGVQYLVNRKFRKIEP
jgi:hypothetical protein